MTIIDSIHSLAISDDQADNINVEPPKTKEKTQKHNQNLDLVMNISVDLQVVLGSTSMPISTLMNLERGSVVILDKQIGDPVDIVVNGRVVARGKIIIMNEDPSRFGVTLTELLTK